MNSDAETILSRQVSDHTDARFQIFSPVGEGYCSVSISWRVFWPHTII